MHRADLVVEQGEAAAVEGAIVWRAQAIVETLQRDELDAWLKKVDLAGAIGELKSEVERMETVVNGVKGRAVGNKPLARSLARVKELMYDADDVVDELDYCRLQQQVEGVNLAPDFEPEGMVGDGDNRDGAEHVAASASTAAGKPDNNGRKNRSKERDYFHITPAVNGEPASAKCIDCGTQVVFSHGTSVLHKHRNSASCKKKRAAIEQTPNYPSASDSVQNGGAIISTNDLEGRKRLRIDDNIATTTNPWDRANVLKRIHEIALELQGVRGYVTEYLKDSVTSFHQYHSNTPDTQVRTSGSRPQKFYGRSDEINSIMRVIKKAKSDNITVLPIVGIVGIGKTTLAKRVYNDLLVRNQFEQIWVWVSNVFDEVRVTREILDVVTLNSDEGSPRNRESYEGLSNYTKLQEVLKNHMSCRSKKFLLVLDDVNDCMVDSQWKDLLDALGSSCTKGNVIIVTARKFSVAQRLGTVEPVKLRALGDKDFLLLFKECAFGDSNYRDHVDIGHQIAAKLKGNPLAAKSAAEMLREQPTLGHWKSTIKNGVWESLQLRGGIVTTLKISYYQLHYQLQQCFLFCSIFPSDHQFHIDDLVSLWIRLGFVKSIEMGRDYFNALVNSCFFEKVGADDDFILHHKQCYVMCGIMHEFARLVSRTEFATIDGLECKEVPTTVRHFSILTDSVYRQNECGIRNLNVKFEEKMKNIVSSARRLRTLILIRNSNTFTCNLVKCAHLRHLKLEDKESSEVMHISLSKLYHLEVLDVGCRAIIHGTSDLINMRNLVLTKGAIGASPLASTACLQMIHLEDCGGCEIIPSLERLSSLKRLKLRNMPEVTELLIPLVEELVLNDMPNLDRCSCSSVRDLNSSLRVLDIKRCRVLKAFPVFESCEKFGIEHKSWLPNVIELTINECRHLMVSNCLPPSSSFCKLSITKVPGLPTMTGSSDGELKIESYGYPSSMDYFLGEFFLSFHNLRTIIRLRIGGLKNLLSISLEGLRQLVCLKRLEIRHCTNIFSSDVPSVHAHEDMAAANFDALPSLECLEIYSCGITGGWLSVMLQHVRGLEELDLHFCEQITGLLIEGKDNSLSNLTSAPRASSRGNPDGELRRTCTNKLLRVPSNLIPSLKKMTIEHCELTFQGSKEGLSGFTSLEEVRIFYCPELIPSLVHEDEIDDQADGRLLLPSSLGALDINVCASLETLQPCFPGDLTRLTVLSVWGMSGLKSLRLHSCTALETLKIHDCKSLDALEGVQYLGGLRCLEVYGCPRLKSLRLHSCTALETLKIGWCQSLDALEGVQYLGGLETLKIRWCESLDALEGVQYLGGLRCLRVYGCPGLKSLRLHSCTALETLKIEWCESLDALEGVQSLTSLQELRFQCYYELSNLPAGLHSLPSLKRLEIFDCSGISRLPEGDLPPSLEELEVRDCSRELTEQCRKLATRKLNVKIDGEYVN